ncbi:MAG TPA: hypothetical protein QGF08_02500 [Candidatus Marinimicrobia bacterium]|jgi:hypothetical protein|nr:hypothetical protein [Candidatus Neomarinimicrobiota bacterium]MDP6275877.1 hypothetical protein [Candidatus Neomarinimicrobiota bacterium]MDP7216807.1 hypothetical protein [Candidatus Neomarinimicrobiota bacterium]MDP7436400.1 hypothetical protein [Candidatus Neomarinimicrobiota bacterium]HBN45812.1 hypothetical protein [Candidatus Neomarinimicrobiota bacterium]|tara:strand:- start:1869 stop:2816 length:948 start_codon:yes stop_codon:yes gene_type:complete
MPSTKSPETVQQGGQELIQRITNLISQAVAADFDHQPSDHPLIFANAVKNIIGDDRGNPSQKLLDLCANYCDQFSARKNDQEMLDKIVKDGFGLTVFVDDVKEAIMSGNKDAAELETAKQLLASDKSPAILELLAELALHDIDSLGLFTYHWLRSYQFHQDKEMLWPYCRSMVHEIFKGHLQQQRKTKLHKPQDHLSNFLTIQNKGLWSTYSAISRLWTEDSLRSASYRKSISTWLNIIKNNEVDATEDHSGEFENYIYNGGRYFIGLAEEMVDKHSANAAVQKIIVLEALRGLAKNVPPESFPHISRCINFIAS